jgi:hypothetical protein
VVVSWVVVLAPTVVVDACVHMQTLFLVEVAS